jgi:hypothetical protein
MKERKVRHNKIDTRKIEIVQYSTRTYHMLDTRYDDLYADYKQQQRNVYIKPKRAIRAWHKASTDAITTGPVRTVKEGNKRILSELSRKRLFKELGM